MSIRINSHIRSANVLLPGWQVQCMPMPDMAIMERWWRIFTAGFWLCLALTPPVPVLVADDPGMGWGLGDTLKFSWRWV